jgi:hypothetical protein
MRNGAYVCVCVCVCVCTTSDLMRDVEHDAGGAHEASEWWVISLHIPAHVCMYVCMYVCMFHRQNGGHLCLRVCERGR